MKKVSIDNLIIEVTRRCNMTCEHCLRWDAEPIDLDTKYIKILFKSVEYVSIITFTWGEPSLVPNIISEIIDIAKENNVVIGCFYIATNGKLVTQDFLFALLKLYNYCSDNEISQLQLSNDIYHEKINNKLDLFKFFSKRNKEDNATYNLISEWRAEESWIGTRYAEPDKVIIDDYSDNQINWDFYVNCLWEIIEWCDFSFESQSEHKICDITDKLDLIKTINDFNENR